MINYYNILGLEQNANIQEIKQAYRKLSKKFHPDVNQGDDFFEKMFLQIQEAYEVLSNDQMRLKYDTILYGAYHNTFVPKTESSLPKIKNFSVDNSNISSDEVFTLTWDVQNADFVQIRPLGVFPTSGYEKFKFNKLKGQSVNLVIIATNTETGTSAREHLVIYNKDWKPSFFEENKKMDFTILLLRIIIITIIVLFLLAIIFIGVEKVDPVQQSLK